MGFWDWFGGGPGRGVTEAEYRENLGQQLRMTPMTLRALREHGVSTSSMIRLEFHFSANSADKAAALAAGLGRLGYQVDPSPKAAARGVRPITGWTQAMVMRDEVVLAWTRKMCESARAYDCSFEGWGTDGRG